jgi:hypothetical protein
VTPAGNDTNDENEDVPFEAVPTRGRGEIVDLRGLVLSKRQESARWKRILRTKTRPWRDDEFFRVEGIPCVYRLLAPVGTVIHLPGGRSLFIRDAWVKRLHLEEPRTLRVDDIYNQPPATRKDTL